MNKPFTMATVGILFLVAAAHLYRFFADVTVSVGTHTVPLWASAVGAITASFLGIMVCVEAKK